MVRKWVTKGTARNKVKKLGCHPTWISVTFIGKLLNLERTMCMAGTIQNSRLGKRQLRSYEFLTVFSLIVKNIDNRTGIRKG